MLAAEINKIQVTEINKQWFQVVAILTSCLTALSFGLNFGWTSPSLPILEKDFQIPRAVSSYFPVVQSTALMLTCPLLAFSVERIGRKRCLHFVSVAYLISWILTASANSVEVFFVARLFAGIGDAGVFTVLPMYIGEVAEPKVRGMWGNMVALGLYFGQFLINVIGSYASIRVTAIICAMVPVVHLVAFWFMPESPYYLLMKKRTADARDALRKLRWRNNVEEELSALDRDVQKQISERGTLKDLFCKGHNRRALMVGTGLRMAQQFCGMPAFGVYTQNLFEQAGGKISRSTSSIIYTGSLLIIMGANMFIMDRLGRRIAMMVSSIGCGLCLFGLAAFDYVATYELMDVSSVKWLYLFGLIVWLLFAGSGLGLVPLLMLGELFSASVKGMAINVVCIVFAISFLTVTKIFQELMDHIHLYAPFAFFGACSFVIFVFSYFCVPETRGKTLEEIQQVLKRRKVKLGT